jgi:hypothetical protein
MELAKQNCENRSSRKRAPKFEFEVVNNFPNLIYSLNVRFNYIVYRLLQTTIERIKSYEVPRSIKIKIHAQNDNLPPFRRDFLTGNSELAFA